MTDTRFFYGAAHEGFPPSELIRQAVAAEKAGFEGISASDHLQPWWEPGESGQAWTWLGATGQATESVALGTGVTAPMYRYNPVIVAQAFATLEEMFPGRAFLGVGSGEALNETPCGADWPDAATQVERMAEALEIISGLYDGERVTFEGEHFKTDGAYLHTRGERRPPVYVSAFGPEAAKVAGRWGDGLWTLADPETVPDLIDTYKGACDDAGKEPGEILLHTGFSWDEDEETAFESARKWKSTGVDEYYTDDIHDPQEMYERAEREISDDEFKESFILTSDIDEHISRIREIEEMGATIVILMNITGSDPHAAIDTYGTKVLPALRGESS
jgi:coenzyme F420-dependent glucose-6-phosphate dehydrogenase